MDCWINIDDGSLYYGDCRAGDRAATAQEIAAFLLKNNRTIKRSLLNEVFFAHVEAGVAFGDKAVSIGDLDRTDVAIIAIRALAVVQGLAGATWPAGFEWRTKDGTWVPVSAAQFLSLAQTMTDRYYALRARFYRLADQIEAAADAATLDAIDIQTGW